MIRLTSCTRAEGTSAASKMLSEPLSAMYAFICLMRASSISSERGELGLLRAERQLACDPRPVHLHVGLAPRALAARTSAITIASGTSKASMRTRSPFFRGVENPVSPSASCSNLGSMIMGFASYAREIAPRKRVLGKADPPHRLVEVRGPPDDLDLEAKVVHRQRAAARVGDADRVLLGRDEALRALALGGVVELLQVLGRVAVVVEEALPAHEERPRSRRNFSKLSGVAIPQKAKIRRPLSHSRGSRPRRAGAHVERWRYCGLVRALDDVRVGLVPRDQGLESGSRLPFDLVRKM